MPATATEPMLPDNRCCFCLTLKKGSALIALAFIVISICLLFMNISSTQSPKGEVNTLEILVIVIFCFQLFANWLLLMGAYKKLPIFTVPWLVINGILFITVKISIFALLFSGSKHVLIFTRETATDLYILGGLAGSILFCWLIIYHFRKFLIDERRILTTYMPTAPNVEEAQINDRKVCTPPPSYDEIAKSALVVDGPAFKKLNGDLQFDLDERPPEYDVAVANSKAN